jgi:hypothetical protein
LTIGFAIKTSKNLPPENFDADLQGLGLIRAQKDCFSPWWFRKKPKNGWLRKKLQIQGAQKLRSEAHLLVRLNDEVEAQRRRWTFYEAIIFGPIIIAILLGRKREQIRPEAGEFTNGQKAFSPQRSLAQAIPQAGG